MNSCTGCDTLWTGTSRCHCSGCHQTFIGIALFDAHRSQYGDRGACLDPASVVTSRTGEPVMFLREGIWRGPEMTPEQRVARFGDVA